MVVGVCWRVFDDCLSCCVVFCCLVVVASTLVLGVVAGVIGGCVV